MTVNRPPIEPYSRVFHAYPPGNPIEESDANRDGPSVRVFVVFTVSTNLFFFFVFRRERVFRVVFDLIVRKNKSKHHQLPFAFNGSVVIIRTSTYVIIVSPGRTTEPDYFRD